jgi:hypothetical protein
MSRARVTVRRTLVVLALIILPVGYVLHPASASTALPLVIAMALFIECVLLLVVFAGWGVRLHFMKSARTDLATKQSASAFSCRVSAESFRWLNAELPDKALEFWAAGLLSALITHTGIELWWTSPMAPPQRLFVGGWDEFDHVLTTHHWPGRSMIEFAFKIERPPLILSLEPDSFLPIREDQLQTLVLSMGVSHA